MQKRYVGKQSFWNENAINEREKYYYGYGGFWGKGVSKDPSDYEVLLPQPVPCDALKQDCWNKACSLQSSENFDSGPSGAGSLIGIVGIVTAVVLFCKYA